MAERVLIDIEGTVGDIAFVRNVLFPYAHQALSAFLREHGSDPEVEAQVEAAATEGGVDADDMDAVVKLLRGWIETDRKATPLKALQGIIWQEGYRDGAFKAHLFEDAWRRLRDWHRGGVPLFVYSSGSVEAQKLYFANTGYGDISEWFDGFFDTRIGHKRESESYRRIVAEVGGAARRLAFFSDVVEELDAARQAGLRTVHIQREGGPAGNINIHPCFPSFAGIDLDQI